tara:strand:- start:123 stop:1118 length:996 start_codon:yes stop_codon:yes gene_type:complete
MASSNAVFTLILGVYKKMMRITCLICSTKFQITKHNTIPYTSNRKNYAPLNENDDIIVHCTNCNTLYSADLEKEKYCIDTWVCDCCGIESVDEEKINLHEEECFTLKRKIKELNTTLNKEKDIIKDLNLNVKNFDSEETRIKLSAAANTAQNEIDNIKETYQGYKLNIPPFTSKVTLYATKQYEKLIEEIEDKRKEVINIINEEIKSLEVSLEQLYSFNNLSNKIKEIRRREKALDYSSAIKMWEELDYIEEAARVRKLQAKMNSVNVAQNVVHGDQVTKTEIKDSVVSKSNVGSGGDDKFTKLKELTEMKEKGFIDDDEFKQMKKEILGK